MPNSSSPSSFVALTNFARRIYPPARAACIPLSDASADAPADAAAATATAPVQAGATPPASEVIPTAPITDGSTQPLTTVAVLVGHRELAFAQILVGVMGRIKDDQFTIDPAYQDLAYLFSLAGTGNVDLERADFELLQMPESDVAAFRANLIRGLAKDWSELYANVAKLVPVGDLGARMLASERTKVADNVARFLTAQALQSYDVPVVLDVSVPQPCEALRLDDPGFRTTEADLVMEGRRHIASMQINPHDDIIPTPLTTPASATLPEQMRGHTGAFALKVQSTVQLLATDPEQAARLIPHIHAVENRTMIVMRNVLTLGPLNIQNANLVPYQMPVDNDFDEGNGFRDRG